MGTRAYTAVIGTAELHGWYESDSKAIKVAERWVRLFWRRFVASQPEGSIARYACDNETTLRVGRHHWHPARGVVGFGISQIHSLTL